MGQKISLFAITTALPPPTRAAAQRKFMLLLKGLLESVGEMREIAVWVEGSVAAKGAWERYGSKLQHLKIKG